MGKSTPAVPSTASLISVEAEKAYVERNKVTPSSKGRPQPRSVHTGNGMKTGLTWVGRYGVAVVAVVAGGLLRWGLTEAAGDLPLFITFYPPVALVAMAVGPGAGIAATILSAATADWFFMPPVHSLSITTAAQAVSLGLFITAGLLISFMAGLLERSWQRQATLTAQREAAEDLTRAAEETARQKHLLGVTLASVGDAVIATDTRGLVVFLNAEAERLTGWKNDEAAGKPLATVFRIVNEHTRQPVENPAEKVLRLGTVVGLANHTVLIAKDGRETPIDDSGAPIRQDDGAVHGVVLVFRDITERRAAERSLHKSEQRYRELFNTMTEGFALHEIITDKQGRPSDYRFLDVNPAFERLTGLKSADIVGKRVLEVLPGVESHWIDSYGKVALTGEPVSFENHAVELDRWYGVFAYRPAPGQFAAIFTDITRRKQTEEALIRSATETARQKDLLAVTLASIGDGVVVTDTQGRVTFLNDEAERLTGWTNAEAAGEPLATVFRIVNEQTRQPVESPAEKVLRLGTVVGLANHTVLIAKDGRETPIDDSGAPIRQGDGAVHGVVLVFRDITERNRAGRYREMTLKILHLLNQTQPQADAVKGILLAIKASTGVEAIGIRLQDGDDYPYCQTSGFSEDFVEMERSLCQRDLDGQIARDAQGHPALECMCGNVIRGRIDPGKPFFTPGGSFWSNHTTQLLASTTEADRLARTRNRCNGEGYESVALIPLRSNEKIVGLLQLNDHRKDMFTPDMMRFLEGVGASVGVALERQRAADALRESDARYRSLFESMSEGLAYCQMLYRDGQPEDFVYLDANSALESITGLKAVIGKKVTEIIPGIRQSNPELFEIYGRVATTGRPESFETYVPTLGTWFSVSTYSPQKGRFVAVFENITARKTAEEALRESELRYRTLVESVNLGISLVGPDYRVLASNAAQARLTGRPAQELVGNHCFSVFRREEHVCTDCPGQQAMATGKPAEREHTGFRHDGSPFFARVQAFPLPARDGRAAGFIEVVEDITERRRLEDQFRQAQKMEAIGQLAGGVAHDFRNQLTIIKGFGEMLLRRSWVLEEGEDHLLEILKAADRSALLTGQLLAFSRKQTLEPRQIDLSEVIADISRGLRRMIGEDIQLQIIPCSARCFVEIDPGQLQQALFNLATNARDAMPKGGTLAIETSHMHPGEDFLKRHPDAQSVPYAAVAIRDTGHGMDDATQGRLFEPFFTTKEVGQGTGLGLAMVYGFVKQSGGVIEVESQPEKGSTFTLYFPQCQTNAQADTRHAGGQANLQGGTETILVVEDEEAVRRMLMECLRESGYTVLEADSGPHALEVIGQSADEIDLVITDVVMPGGSGVELVQELAESWPGMSVLYMSGYPEKELTKRGAAIDPGHMVAKPYDHDAMLTKVRQVLDAARRNGHRKA